MALDSPRWHRISSSVCTSNFELPESRYETYVWFFVAVEVAVSVFVFVFSRVVLAVVVVVVRIVDYISIRFFPLAYWRETNYRNSGFLGFCHCDRITVRLLVTV